MPVVFPAAAHPDDARPNILFFLSDDQRNDHLGCAGHAILQTPHIDRLASAGIRFENAFVTTSICAASRASFFTGLHERTHRYTFGSISLGPEIANDAWPRQLRDAGYRTGFVGKFGIGLSEDLRKRWFDHFIPVGRSPYFKPQVDGSLRHASEITGDRAIEFLNDSPRDQPFCLQVSFNAGHAEDSDLENHYPWPVAVNSLYSETVFPNPRLNDPRIYAAHPRFLKDSLNRERFFWRWDTPEKYQENMRGYYRMLSGMDRVIGRVLETLQRLDLDDNTVVIFASDNGYYMGQRGFAGKWSHYEESLRIPLVIADPRQPVNLRGITVSSMALNIDLAPTILEMAGIESCPRYPGRSLVPFVNGESPPNWRTKFFCEHLMQIGTKIPKWEGVRGSRWVYARYFEQEPAFEFLHDLLEDPDQLINLADSAEHVEVLQDMRAACDELRDEYGGVWSAEKFPRRK